MQGQLLIVEDEERLRTALHEYFTREGFDVALAADGPQALEMLETTHPALILLDVVLLPQGENAGHEVCKEIRKRVGMKVSIIMTSAIRKEELDQVVGLEVGADVYMLKPFALATLLAQVRALLRHRQANVDTPTDILVVDDYLSIDLRKREVRVGGRLVDLSAREFEVLEYLSRQPGQPFTRTELGEKVWKWGAAAGDDAAINTCISRLRRKIECDYQNPKYVLSVQGVGYKFCNFQR